MTLSAAISAPRGVIAASDERKLDTARIQQALDHCEAGHAVVLRSNGVRNIFLAGPLTLRSNVTLVVDKDTALVASRDSRVYDLSPYSRGKPLERGHECKPLITGDGAVNSGIMGDGSIDGRDGAMLLGQKVTWWDLAHQAKVLDKSQSVFSLIWLRHADNFTLYSITLRNSPNYHVNVSETNGFTAWGMNIMTPKTARDTDGIDPSSCRNVTIAYSNIHTGDDDAAVKLGKGGPSSNISILHSHFYTGHGMSVGGGTDVGNHDTVYTGTRNCAPDGENSIVTRQYFSDCYVAGNVDFLLGDSKAVYDRCEIHSTAHSGGYITAQARHYPEQDSGFVIAHSRLTANPDLKGTVYLGRPWRSYAKVIFLDTKMGAHIDPAGWREWHPGETHSIETVYYAEFNSMGPGAHHGQRDPHTHFLTPQDARE